MLMTSLTFKVQVVGEPCEAAFDESRAKRIEQPEGATSCRTGPVASAAVPGAPRHPSARGKDLANPQRRGEEQQ